MPRKLIALQAIVVVGLVALVYFTLLRPDDGGPPQVVDAPGDTRAEAPGTGGDGTPGDRKDRGDGSRRDGGASSRGIASEAGPQAGFGSGRSGALGAPGLPGSPSGPDGSAPPGDTPPGGPYGDGDYGPGDDQYGNAVTRLQERMGIGTEPMPQP